MPSLNRWVTSSSCSSTTRHDTNSGFSIPSAYTFYHFCWRICRNNSRPSYASKKLNTAGYRLLYCCCGSGEGQV
ncbi:hypothetical protein BDP27DRAFT_1321379 [Rhodocollybia butyracea]|uniref:Uncharacterized protein n=1 Tax=Rhodocollybia butyracea TaxID=206335 RepID=A0A9P5PYW2_9AGAR|nr:hypothetical protein BDP27DRAFT_1321379 [Rhodocollybia butyracea]